MFLSHLSSTEKSPLFLIKTSLITYSGFLNVQLCPNLLLFMHRRLQNMEHTLSQSVDSEHSQFDHEKDTITVIQNMRFYVRLLFPFVFECMRNVFL